MAKKTLFSLLAKNNSARLDPTNPYLLISSMPRKLFKSGREKYRNLKNQFAPKVFVSTEAYRSQSDDGSYVAFVERANRDYNVFSKFKSHPHYRAVLEHVSKEQGQDYLDIIIREFPAFIDQIEKFKINDVVGAPVTEFYPDIGEISPTTLRYVKVAADLTKHFGDTIGSKVCEIGVGYGGQYLILDQVFQMKQYHLFDLPQVLTLASKYLESHLLNSSYKMCTLNQCDGSVEFDCAISNYAFSELPPAVQKKYAEKILSRSRRGYLTMNSGREDSVFKHHLSVESLAQILPSFEIEEERPLTAPGNYIIVW